MLRNNKNEKRLKIKWNPLAEQYSNDVKRLEDEKRSPWHVRWSDVVTERADVMDLMMNEDLGT